MQIIYLSKFEMFARFRGDYFGVTQHFSGAEPKIYIRNDLPKCVQASVLAHEQYHAKGNHDEFGAWLAGLRGNWKGFFFGILLSLRPSRLKLYPELVSAICVVCGFAILVYINS
jgi:hypothetical protein